MFFWASVTLLSAVKSKDSDNEYISFKLAIVPLFTKKKKKYCYYKQSTFLLYESNRFDQ
jgi:hypothetical protein